ncbi:MAG: hypothetical protein AAF645_09230, partial [Myxococcota bacterium]
LPAPFPADRNELVTALIARFDRETLAALLGISRPANRFVPGFFTAVAESLRHRPAVVGRLLAFPERWT